MADISYLSQLVNGKQNSVQLPANTLVLLSVKVGGSSSNTELTKAILDNLVLLQSGSYEASSLHNHNTLYFTKTQLGAVTSSSGASLIGVNLTATNYTAGAQTVEAHLAGINSALGSISINNFNDSLFNIYSNGDNTKKIKFVAGGITTGNSRTITMPDANVDLGNLTNSNIASGAAIAYSKLNLTGSLVNADVASGAAIAYSKLNLTGSIVNADIASAAAIALSKLSALTTSRALVSDGSGVISTSTVTSTELGYVSGVTSSIQSQLNNLSSTIQGYEWQNSVISATLLTPPGSPVTGDRYLINGTGTGVWAGHNNTIAQWSGSAWVYTTPTTGTFVASDAEPNVLYLFGGTTWSSKAFESTTASTGLTKVGFDLQLAASSAGSGLTFTAGVHSVNTDSTTTQITGGNVAVKLDGAGAIGSSASGIAVNLESTNPTLQISTNKLGVKLDAARAITTGASGIGVNIDTGTMAITTNALGVKAAGISATQLASGAFDQATITGGAGTAAQVAYSPASKIPAVAGQAFSANTTYLVRWAITGETAGRVYAADKDATSANKYFAFGIFNSGVAVSAGASILVTTLGSITQGSADTAFSSANVGLELYVGTAGAIILGSSLSNATFEAAVCIGVVQSTNQIWFTGPQVRGIN